MDGVVCEDGDGILLALHIIGMRQVICSQPILTEGASLTDESTYLSQTDKSKVQRLRK